MFHALSSAPTQGLRLPSTPQVAPEAARQAAKAEPDVARNAQTDAKGDVSRPQPQGGRKVEASSATKKAELSLSTRSAEDLSEEEQRQVQKLKQVDAEVRAHEQAHSAAGGGLAGGASYQFITGPDGKRYAVGGEVQIDVSPVSNNPAATVRKMETVIRAALAPAEPSSQDQSVARDAAKLRSEAQAELQRQYAEARQGESKSAATHDHGDHESRSAAAEAPTSIRLAAIKAYGGDPNSVASEDNQSEEDAGKFKGTEIASEIFSAANQLSPF